jgi:hypothetical protein
MAVPPRVGQNGIEERAAEAPTLGCGHDRQLLDVGIAVEDVDDDRADDASLATPVAAASVGSERAGRIGRAGRIDHGHPRPAVVHPAPQGAGGEGHVVGALGDARIADLGEASPGGGADPLHRLDVGQSRRTDHRPQATALSGETRVYAYRNTCVRKLLEEPCLPSPWKTP